MKVDIKLGVLVVVVVVLLVGFSEVSGIRRTGSRIGTPRISRSSRIIRTTRTTRTTRTFRTIRTTRTFRTIRRTSSVRSPSPIIRRTTRTNVRSTTAPTPRQTYSSTISWNNPFNSRFYRSTMSWDSPFNNQSARSTMSWNSQFGRSTITPINRKSTMKTRHPIGARKPSNYQKSKPVNINCLDICEERDSCRSVNQCYRLYNCPERCGGIRHGVSRITIAVTVMSFIVTLTMIN